MNINFQNPVYVCLYLMHSHYLLLLHPFIPTFHFPTYFSVHVSPHSLLPVLFLRTGSLEGKRDTGGIVK